jgi:hypothetical protein
MRNGLPLLALSSLLPSTFASPAPIAAQIATSAPTAAPSLNDATTLEERQLLGGLLSGLDGAVISLIKDVNSAVAAQDPLAINSALIKITPASRPTDIPDCLIRASKVWASPAGRTDFYAAIATQVAVGLGPLLDGTLSAALTGGLPIGENRIDNDNPKSRSTIFPKKTSEDAPYSLSEDALRKAIYIPPDFGYGTKRPVIMIPGTGSYGGFVFANNLRKLLTGQPWADPVWLNVPGAMLGDAQVNSEYIAYAINYISSISAKNNSKNAKEIAIISWSQGGLDTQWVFKYWPSTTKVVTDFLPVSADFRGTILTNILCLSPDTTVSLNPLCAPSAIQQEATSNYVRLGGGNTAYVPTTSFFSGFFDEVVEPQQGTLASAYVNAGPNAPVSNIEVQKVCAGKLGGTFYGHAGVLFHPLTYALVVDALKNNGPGSLSRIDVDSVCNSYTAPGLDLDDVIATLGLIPVAGVSLLAYPDRRSVEPRLMSYVE